MVFKPLKPTLTGTVEQIIKPSGPDEPEQARISVEGADEFHAEIRIDNTLTKEDGDEVRLKKGASVSIAIKA